MSVADVCQSEGRSSLSAPQLVVLVLKYRHGLCELKADFEQRKRKSTLTSLLEHFYTNKCGIYSLPASTSPPSPRCESWDRVGYEGHIRPRAVRYAIGCFVVTQNPLFMDAGTENPNMTSLDEAEPGSSEQNDQSKQIHDLIPKRGPPL